MASKNAEPGMLRRWLSSWADGFACWKPIGNSLGLSGAGDSTQTPCEEQAPPASARLPLPLNVGFADVKLMLSEGVPPVDLIICSTDESDIARENIEAMLDFLDFAMDLPLASEGFQLVYDVPEIGTAQMEVIRSLVCWSCEPGRQATWQKRCKRWKIIVAEGVYMRVSKMLLTGVFYLYPPPCFTYLLRDNDPAIHEDDPDLVVFEPNDETLAIARLGDDLQHKVESWTEDASKDAPCSEDAHVQEAPGGEETVADTKPWLKRSWGACPPKVLDVGFAEIHQGFDGEEGFLKIFGSEGDLTDEGLEEMMDFMDAFSHSSSAEQGFSIMYDLRSLRSPSMQMVTKVAEWGSEPSRQKLWERLNHSCKIVISAGLKYTLAKGILTTFFLICPPVCRTYLLSDPDEPLQDATLFRP
eukprot:TRINITY_DN33445_c0_g1_i1.p1 TRINITY_DN33445_c0_g1~~TRINITY_DN33445_c0_g1_i1.p1  ORF type:complete len:414 (-),score=81.91 TRINITY_DN33445_c0_g1_i1:38-1279(-)